jgi:hypothetical protein
MATRQTQTRIPEGLEAAVREAQPDLANEALSVLVRVGLAVLAGYGVAEALGKVKGHPVPRELSPKSAA